MKAGRAVRFATSETYYDDGELGTIDPSNEVFGAVVRTTRAGKALTTKYKKRTMKQADQTMVEVCAGDLGASAVDHIHAVSPKQQWQLSLRIE